MPRTTSQRPAAESPGAIRLDIWLWAARMFKTRSLAKAAIEAGRVAIDEQACKASRAVRVGDRITLTRANERHELTVLAVSAQRGPAQQAQGLYIESDASRQARESAREQRRLQGAGYSAPAARPDKRARRSILRLQDDT
jgi:ribosome-associated heat shock protein Hsp15